MREAQAAPEPDGGLPRGWRQDLRHIGIAGGLLLLIAFWPVTLGSATLFTLGRHLPRRRHLQLLGASALLGLFILALHNGVRPAAQPALAWRPLLYLFNHWSPWTYYEVALALLGGSAMAATAEAWLMAPVNENFLVFLLRISLRRLRRTPPQLRVELGRDTTSRRSLVLGERELVEHVLVVGATGTGKTNTLLRIIGEVAR